MASRSSGSLDSLCPSVKHFEDANHSLDATCQDWDKGLRGMLNALAPSGLERHDDAEHLVRGPYRAGGRRRADMGAAVRRGDLDDLLRRHPDPPSVFLHLVVVAGRADFGRAAIGEIAAGGLGVGAQQLRIELGVPLGVALAMIAFR